VIASVGGSGAPSADNAPLVLPSAIGSYPQITDASAARIRAAIQTQYGSTGTIADFFDKAAVGVYGSPGASTAEIPRLVLVTARESQFPDFSPSSLAGGGLGTGLGTSNLPFTSYPAGSLGGALRCAGIAFAGLSENICIWSDQKTVGFLVSIQTTLTTDQVASLVNRARTSLEH
jgi:hypothetical protein